MYLVVHLFGAVEDVDHDSERSSEVLGRLGLAGARRSGRRAAHRQMQRLRQSYVASAHRIITQMKHASESTLKYDKPERPRVRHFNRGLSYFIVVRPTMSCFAD